MMNLPCPKVRHVLIIYFLNITFSIVLGACWFWLVILSLHHTEYKILSKKSQGLLFIMFYQHTHEDILYSITVARTQSWLVANWNLDEMLNKHNTTKEQKADGKLFWSLTLLVNGVQQCGGCVWSVDFWLSLLTVIASCLNTFTLPGHVGLLWTKHCEEQLQLMIMPSVLKSLDCSKLNGPQQSTYFLVFYSSCYPLWSQDFYRLLLQASIYCMVGV